MISKKKDQNQFARSKLAKLDNGVLAWEKKYLHMKEVYNVQAKRFQELKTKTDNEISQLESKLGALEEKLGGVFVCPNCSKEYKTQKGLDNHLPKCEEEKKSIIDRQKQIEELERKKIDLQKELDLKKLEEVKEELDKGEEAELKPNNEGD